MYRAVCRAVQGSVCTGRVAGGAPGSETDGIKGSVRAVEWAM